jgi:hypothetical protein
MKTNDDDPGYCGLAPLETGDWDPYHTEACYPHDKHFNDLKAGTAKQSTWVTARKFAVNSSIVFARSLYGVVAFPLYLVIGAIGGALREEQIRNRSAPDTEANAER